MEGEVMWETYKSLSDNDDDRGDGVNSEGIVIFVPQNLEVLAGDQPYVVDHYLFWESKKKITNMIQSL
jgi:hypothetical protein